MIREQMRERERESIAKRNISRGMTKILGGQELRVTSTKAQTQMQM